jgi:hypothetical protein
VNATTDSEWPLQDFHGGQLYLALPQRPCARQDVLRSFGFVMISDFTIMPLLQLLQRAAILMSCLFSASILRSLTCERPLDFRRQAPFVAGFCFKRYQI